MKAVTFITSGKRDAAFIISPLICTLFVHKVKKAKKFLLIFMKVTA